jgi:hypothetical protein
MIVDKPINLDQLANECRAAGQGGELILVGNELTQADAQGNSVELSSEQQALVDTHVAMRCKTDAELAAEFADPNTTAGRRQEIRDMQAGLLPCEQVPMT